MSLITFTFFIACLAALDAVAAVNFYYNGFPSTTERVLGEWQPAPLYRIPRLLLHYRDDRPICLSGNTTLEDDLNPVSFNYTAFTVNTYWNKSVHAAPGRSQRQFSRLDVYLTWDGVAQPAVGSGKYFTCNTYLTQVGFDANTGIPDNRKQLRWTVDEDNNPSQEFTMLIASERYYPPGSSRRDNHIAENGWKAINISDSGWQRGGYAYPYGFSYQVDFISMRRWLSPDNDTTQKPVAPVKILFDKRYSTFDDKFSGLINVPDFRFHYADALDGTKMVYNQLWQRDYQAVDVA